MIPPAKRNNHSDLYSQEEDGVVVENKYSIFDTWSRSVTKMGVELGE